jgi:hypothetical protein
LDKQIAKRSKVLWRMGLEHIYLTEAKVSDPTNYYSKQIPHLGQILNEEVPQTKGKVLSIAYIYMMPQSGEKSSEILEEFTHVNLLTDYQKANISLFKLKGKNSPFKYMTVFVDRATRTGTLNYFQYMILIQNSPASVSFFDKN